ncbi:MAG: division/cell wall cluster transcriptional repressor MraZ [Lachnospiraceae bacterium]|nr:division/cell wall cluster transcriptional repressor MraZ [Lachnospiraceae bacterium]
MLGLIGQYNHTIDTKGRLSIPSKFRGILGNEFIVAKSIDGCLNIYTLAAWEEQEKKLSELPSLDKNARDLKRFLHTGVATVEPDPHGRILVPMVLREYAGLNKDVTIIGMNDKAEIWDTERFERKNSEFDMDGAAEALLSKGISI